MARLARVIAPGMPHHEMERGTSVNCTQQSHLTFRNLAVLAEERGDRVESRRLWRMVLDACPGDAEATSRGEAQR